MAHIPHFMNLGVRVYQVDLWRWQHNWEAHQHTYSGIVTLRMRRAHPCLQGVILITMRTVLTLDLSLNHHFPHPSTSCGGRFHGYRYPRGLSLSCSRGRDWLWLEVQCRRDSSSFFFHRHGSRPIYWWGHWHGGCCTRLGGVRAWGGS